jgi:hypothetical protein
MKCRRRRRRRRREGGKGPRMAEVFLKIPHPIEVDIR